MGRQQHRSDLSWQLSLSLPDSVYRKIFYVHERVHWDEIEVRFEKSDRTWHVVRIPKDQWLNDATIARLCLECP